MKVVLISDTHRCKDYVIPECDVLIHCGDDDVNSKQSALLLNDWLGTLPAANIIFSPGNHDFFFQEFDEVSSIAEAKDIFTNAEIIIDEEIVIDGKRIYCSPWTPTFFDWAFMKPDLNLEVVWDKIPENLDILITHGPPFGILDANSRGDLCGSQTLAMRLLKMPNPPRYNAFGHIHEAYGEKVIGNTTFINCAVTPVWTSDGYSEKLPVIIEI